MSDELDKLKQAMQSATPTPDKSARDQALQMANAEFEKNFQGSAETARPTSERAQWWALPEGAVKMFRRLTARETLLTTASVATIAIAVVITQNSNQLPNDEHGPIVVSEFATDQPVELDGTCCRIEIQEEDRTRAIALGEDAETPYRLDDSVIAGSAAKVEGNEVVAEAEVDTDSEQVASAPLTNPAWNNGPNITFGGTAELGYNAPNDQLNSSLNLELGNGIGDSPVSTLTYRFNLDPTTGASEDTDGEFPVVTLESAYGNLSAGNADSVETSDYVSPAAPMIVAGQEAQDDWPVGGATSDRFATDDFAAADMIQVIPSLEPTVIPEANTEQFPDAAVNPLNVVAQEPVSTFSIDVDTASYGIVRSSLMDGHLPPADAVRTEELVNYFNYDYPLPQAGEAPFSTSVTVMDTPWNADTQLLHIGIQGYDIPAEDRPPVNLVFLIDTSGSMNDANKLPLLINSFRLMLNSLQPDDQVAIVTYAGSAGMALAPTPASDSAKILASLQNLSAGGSTAGQAGLQQAYALAEQMAEDGDTARVILATDGDFNVGISDPEMLQDYVEDKRESGVYLSVLGFGRGNYNDTIMQTLAQNGNGTAAYIDTLAEAQKVLVDQIGGALFTIAQDVKIQIEFNPAEIAEYRLIGYETRALNREDFNNDAVDAGEIGAGHAVTAIYEITPVGSPAISVDELRYAASETEAQPASSDNGEYAFLKLRYKNPGEDVSNLITTPVFADTNAGILSEANFATAVAGFAQLLRGDDRIRGWDIDDALAFADANKGDDPFGYRAEFLTLMRLADSLK